MGLSEQIPLTHLQFKPAGEQVQDILNAVTSRQAMRDRVDIERESLEERKSQNLLSNKRADEQLEISKGNLEVSKGNLQARQDENAYKAERDKVEDILKDRDFQLKRQESESQMAYYKLRQDQMSGEMADSTELQNLGVMVGEVDSNVLREDRATLLSRFKTLPGRQAASKILDEALSTDLVEKQKQAVGALVKNFTSMDHLQWASLRNNRDGSLSTEQVSFLNEVASRKVSQEQKDLTPTQTKAIIDQWVELSNENSEVDEDTRKAGLKLLAERYPWLPAVAESQAVGTRARRNVPRFEVSDNGAVKKINN